MRDLVDQFFDSVQEKHAEWQYDNFPKELCSAELMLLGMHEELFEFANARSTDECVDAAADILVYAVSFATQLCIDIVPPLRHALCTRFSGTPAQFRGEDYVWAYNVSDSTLVGYGAVYMALVVRLGELSQHTLKYIQGIRDAEERMQYIEAKLFEIVAVISSYLWSEYNAKNVNRIPDEIVKAVFEKVWSRNWVDFPNDGVSR